MNYKSKIVMSLLQEAGCLAQEKLHFIMYLLCKKYLANNIYFDFVSVESKPFSFELENEIKQLIKKKKIDLVDWLLTAKDEKRYAKDFAFEEKIALHDAINDKATEFQRDYFASDNEMVFYTIGYEGISLDKYLNKLLNCGVKLLVDVRKNSYSQKFGFSKNELSNALQKVGIKFLHMPELGIESDKRQELVNMADYEKLFCEYENTVLVTRKDKVLELIELLKGNKKIAITCFEADVNCCHRGRVARCLKQLPEFKYRIENL